MDARRQPHLLFLYPMLKPILPGIRKHESITSIIYPQAVAKGLHFTLCLIEGINITINSSFFTNKC